MTSQSFDVKNNKCEICNRVAQSGIVDESCTPAKIRFYCQDHYMAIHDKIASEMKKRNDSSKE